MSMTARTSRSPKGYILLETIVALGVLSIGIFTVQSSIRQASMTQAQTTDYTWARFLLQQVISEAEIQPILEPGTKSGSFPGDFARFVYTRKISMLKVPIPELPPLIPGVQIPGMPIGAPLPPPSGVGEDGQPLLKLEEPYIGRISATVRWRRAGETYEVRAETLFNPDKLWMPMEAQPLASTP